MPELWDGHGGYRVTPRRLGGPGFSVGGVHLSGCKQVGSKSSLHLSLLKLPPVCGRVCVHACPYVLSHSGAGAGAHTGDGGAGPQV